MYSSQIKKKEDGHISDIVSWQKLTYLLHAEFYSDINGKHFSKDANWTPLGQSLSCGQARPSAIRYNTSTVLKWGPFESKAEKLSS